MTQLSCVLPASIMLSFNMLGINPKGKLFKGILDVGSIVMALAICLPVSVAIFEPNIRKEGREIE